MRLSTRSESQPDLAILKPKAAGYRRSHPSANDVALLIEVRDTTLRYDLGAKAQLYARHGIAEYWVVDLIASKIWRHREPQGTRYAERTEIAAGSLTLPGQLGEIVVADLF